MARVGLTAERVALAAADLADEVGFENVTVSALARGFGVKDASLYAHITSLRDLRARIAVRSAVEMADRLAAAVAGRAGKDALLAFGDAYRDYARTHPGRYAAGQTRLDPDAVAEAAAHRPSCGDIVYAVLRAYGLAEPDLTDAARLMRATFHGFVTLEANGGFGHPRDVDASWRRGLDALHALLENWPGEDGVSA
ncbi:MAG: TetR family transcriptional regulator [Streptomycetaceae bacterium]|nr:TetR family transcriptional regulator [Streptomycetaceae bacterium]